MGDLRNGGEVKTVNHELSCGVVFQGSVLLFPCTVERNAVVNATKRRDVW